MFVSGFTIVRNAIKYDYPIVEAITSVLPLCDEFIVAVGNSEDETLALIQSINDPRVKIIQTVWDDTLREGGHVLADETNKAYAAISDEADWCFYIQGDEVIHENSSAELKQAMLDHKDDLRVEGLCLLYRHFYGSYDYVGDSRKWYRREVRIIRKHPDITSYRDAQGFRFKNGRKLNVKLLDAYVHHYGWVKPPEAQQAKQQSFHKMWHDDQWMKQNIPTVQEFDYSQIDSLAVFSGTHPRVMRDRIARMNWKFNFDPTQKRWGLKMRLLMWIERNWGWRIGEYKNYNNI
jgi:hypothetical protein